MTMKTASKLQRLYEAAAREFSHRLTERYGDCVHAVVLYGSVARGAANEESDIDVLVLRCDGKPTRDEMIEISEAVDFENDYRTYVIATGMSEDKLRDISKRGYPIAEAILTEGSVLHDDGTFERIRASKARQG